MLPDREAPTVNQGFEASLKNEVTSWIERSSVNRNRPLASTARDECRRRLVRELGCLIIGL